MSWSRNGKIQKKTIMRKLMVIDACMRDGDSRTRRILEPLVAELGKR